MVEENCKCSQLVAALGRQWQCNRLCKSFVLPRLVLFLAIANELIGQITGDSLYLNRRHGWPCNRAIEGEMLLASF